MVNLQERNQSTNIVPPGELMLEQLNLDPTKLKLIKPSYRSHYRAVINWLTKYQPDPNVTNLEKVRGLLEAFDHLCKVEDWEAAKDILLTPLDSFSKVHIPRQLEFWSLYQEGIQICQKILKKSALDIDVICFRMLGNYQLRLGNYPEATDYYEQSLAIARQIGDRQSEGQALGNLGLTYDSLGQYDRAIDSHQQALIITQEVGDRQGEGQALGNLGLVYNNLGEYNRAIDFYQKYLTIAQEIGDRQGESVALGNLGHVYDSLGQYDCSIDFHQQSLIISREINYRIGEGAALVNIGETQIKLEQYPESLTNNQAALEIFQEIGVREWEAEALKNLAKLHQALGKVEEARQYCQQALSLATELGIPLAAECEALQLQLENQ